MYQVMCPQCPRLGNFESIWYILTQIYQCSPALHNNLHRGLVDQEPVDNSNTILKKALRYTAANDTELFDHVRDLYVEVGDNHLQVFFVISWLLHR